MGFYANTSVLDSPARSQKSRYRRFSGVVSGRRHYHPDEGRWLSRDPIEEAGAVASLLGGREKRLRKKESHLYRFIQNSPIDRYDAYGLEENAPPSSLKGCCCKGKIVLDAPLGTGVYECKSQGEWYEAHRWLEIRSGDSVTFSVGFHPEDEVRIPDATTPKTCSEIKLSPCAYDFDKLRSEIQSRASSDEAQCPGTPGAHCPYTYFYPIYTCANYRSGLISYGESKAKGCTVP